MVFSFNSGYHQHRISILLQTDMGSSMSWVIRLIKDIERINDHILLRCMLLYDQMCSWVCLEKGCPEINFDIWILLITCIPNGFHALYYGVGPPSVPFYGTPIVLVTFNSCLLIMALTVGFEPTHQLLDLTV